MFFISEDILTSNQLIFFLGSRYKHFAKFQNLIDLAYIQLTNKNNESVWPLYKTTDNPEDDANFDNPSIQCLKRIPSVDKEDVWVSRSSLRLFQPLLILKLN